MLEKARSEFHPAVRPIFASKNGRQAELVGSSILLSVSGMKYAVTAAHLVNKWVNSHSIFVGGTEGTTEQLQMRGKIYNNDDLDIAFCKLLDEDLHLLGSTRFLDETQISPNKVSSENRTCMAMGYRLSAHKGKIHTTKRTIQTKLFTYCGSVEQNSNLANKLGKTEEDHFFLNYEKLASSGPDKPTVNTPKPTGISGGPLVDLGNFSSTETLASDNCNGLICGIMIEDHRKHNVLIAVKINHAINAIRSIQKAP